MYNYIYVAQVEPNWDAYTYIAEWLCLNVTESD